MMPLHLLSGFLGSGKTTLLRRMLDTPALGDSAVLVNELGEIGLDHHLLRHIDGETVLLRSGCICCTVRDDLGDALKDLLSRQGRGEIPPFARVVVESTGLADPVPILSTVATDPALRHHFRIGRVVTTVDAVNAALQSREQPEWAKQVAVADHIVITKTDIVSPEALLIGPNFARSIPGAVLHDVRWNSAWMWRHFSTGPGTLSAETPSHGRCHSRRDCNRHPRMRRECIVSAWSLTAR